MEDRITYQHGASRYYASGEAFDLVIAEHLPASVAQLRELENERQAARIEAERTEQLDGAQSGPKITFTFGERTYGVFDQLEGGCELDVLDVTDEAPRLTGYVRDLDWGFVPFDVDGHPGETSLTLRAAVEQLAGL